MMKTMTIGELKKALEGYCEDTPVLIGGPGLSSEPVLETCAEFTMNGKIASRIDIGWNKKLNQISPEDPRLGACLVLWKARRGACL